MQNIQLLKVSGFAGTNPAIYDSRGPVYVKDGFRHFNLPVGEYENRGGSVEVARLVKYRIRTLPIREKFFTFPNLKKLRIITDNDYFNNEIRSKAGIMIHTNEIYFNPKFLSECTTPEFYCVLFHEIGHYFYNSEHKCDMYAIHEMLRFGFNPSQFESFLSILSNKSYDRKVNVTIIAENTNALT